MSKIARYAGNLRAFGSNAQGLERTVFGGNTQADDLTSQVTAAFLRGWGIVGPSENPSMEDFNAAMYTLSQLISYLHQMGIPEWNEEQEYYTGSVCIRSGEIYQSVKDSNLGSEPPSANWNLVLNSKNALSALGLNSGSPAIGIPFFWPSSALPNTVMPEWSNMVFLKWNGASFSATTYPKLALVIPSLTLTESRGEFLRIWDDSRGVDSGRSLLSSQSDALQRFTGEFNSRASLSTSGGAVSDSLFGGTGVFSTSRVSSPSTIAFSTPSDLSVLQQQKITMDSAQQVRTSSETRPRNIAFNFLVRAK